jgi:hypothetical protein
VRGVRPRRAAPPFGPPLCPFGRSAWGFGAGVASWGKPQVLLSDVFRPPMPIPRLPDQIGPFHSAMVKPAVTFW